MYRLEFYKAYSFAAYKLGMASTEYALFTIIYSYYENGGECFYSLKGWADMIYVSTSSIQRAIKNLKKKGIISVSACNYTDSLQYYINENVVEIWKQDYIKIQSKDIQKQKNVKAEKEKEKLIEETVIKIEQSNTAVETNDTNSKNKDENLREEYDELMNRFQELCSK